MSGPDTGTLYYGDCLDWMGQWDDRSVDLIYLDPPFNSKTDYNILYSATGGADAQYRAFSDTWAWDEAAADRFVALEGAVQRRSHDAIVGLSRILGRSGMLAYLTYMAERLEHMHRLLKPTGSLYFHCDTTAAHYLKVLLDAIFGADGFRNEIHWRRYGAHNDVGQGSRHFGRVHDTIFYYARGQQPTWTQLFVPLDPEYVKSTYRHVDETGRRFTTTPMTGPGGAAKGNPEFEWNGHTRYWRYSKETMARLDREGRIHYSKTGYPRRKLYLDESRGVPIQDAWNDIKALSGAHKERMGYPTQKPIALLERIITASSDPEHLILDPFCGCGTTIEAAQRLGRRWAGIDVSSFAIDLIREKRLRDRTIPTKGIPVDLASARKLAAEAPFNFESWAVTRLPGFAPNMKQVADGGVDGRAVLAAKPDDHHSRLALAQIKGGGFQLGALRDFRHVTDRDQAALGCFVTLEPVGSRAARAEAAEAGTITVSGQPYRRMQLWPISEYFDGRLPRLPTMNDPYSGKPMAQRELFA